MAVKVSIQGYEGSFHQVAAQAFFGKGVSVIPCVTFREVVRVAADSTASDGGVMAIENSIAGSILPNYNLLQRSNLHVVGEVYLQIHQNLLANKGVQLQDIKEVHSHPMALLQCIDYLDSHHWKLVETEDTALSAKHIQQHKCTHIAAIASTLAAEMYNLDVLASKIQSEQKNYTRFLVLQNSAAPAGPDANKASLYFQVAHSRGSLARLLTQVAEGGINVSKLQSFPVPGSDWKYSFYADMEFDSAAHFTEVMQAITPLTEALKVYGIYKKGATI